MVDLHRARCPHVPAIRMLDGNFALVGSEWVDLNAEEEMPF